MGAKLHILLVETNAELAAMVRTMLSEEIRSAQIVLAANGTEAWRRLSEVPYDLIISEWDLEGMSGGDLLLKVRSHESTRDVPFVMTTTRSDKVSVVYAIQSGVTDYITKPYARGHFLEKVKMVLARRALELQKQQDEHFDEDPAVRQEKAIDAIKRRIGAGEVDLPVLPEIALRVNEVAKNPEAQVSDIARLIEVDASLASKILSIANSSIYRGVKKFESLEQAVVRLGFKQTQNYVLMISSRGLFDIDKPVFGAMLKRLWLHATAVAGLSRLIAHRVPGLNEDMLYTLGLLHDVGKLLLIHTMAVIPKTGLDADSAHEVVNNMHTRYGAALLRAWHFNEEFHGVCLNHHDVVQQQEAPMDLLTVAAANILVRRLNWSLQSAEKESELGEQLVQRLGLDPAIVPDLLKDTQEYVDEIRTMVWGSMEQDPVE